MIWIGVKGRNGMGSSCRSGVQEKIAPAKTIQQTTNLRVYSLQTLLTIVIKSFSRFPAMVSGINLLLLNPAGPELRILMKGIKH